MKHKVKIFDNTYNNDRLETHMNEWLSEHSNIAIVDIKYSTSQSGSSNGMVFLNHAALIHYMED